MLYGSEEPEALNLLNGMLHTIKDQLKRSLATLKWMDSRGIEEAQKKFNKTKTVFGFTGEDLIDELVGKITPESNYISTLQNVLLWQTRNMFKSVAENNVTVFLNSEVFYSVEKNEISKSFSEILKKKEISFSNFTSSSPLSFHVCKPSKLYKFRNYRVQNSSPNDTHFR